MVLNKQKPLCYQLKLQKHRLYQMKSYEFLKEVLECYSSKYGTAVRFDNYIIGFEPRLYVMELFQ